jgi:hypothetical protein
MPAGAIIALVIVVVLLAAAVAGTLVLRRMALRRRFGPEYDRLAREVGPRRAAAELTERRRRVEELDLRPLTAERRAGYGREWTAAQERFVDSPVQAVKAASSLVTAVAADCGYAIADEDRFLTDLSVYHSPRLAEYRRAREISARPGVPTEELRQALLGYRAMFLDLMWAPDNDVDRAAAPAGTEGIAATGTSATASDAAGPGTDAEGDAATAGGTGAGTGAAGATDRTMAQPTRKG